MEFWRVIAIPSQFLAMYEVQEWEKMASENNNFGISMKPYLMTVLKFGFQIYIFFSDFSFRYLFAQIYQVQTGTYAR